MKHNPLQLSLIPEIKIIRGQKYVLASVAESYNIAKAIASYTRENGCSARIEKDKEGKFDIVGTYLIWVRVSRLVKSMKGTA